MLCTKHHEQTYINVNKTKLPSLAMSAYRKFQLQKMMPSSQVWRVDAETEEEIIYEPDCEHLEISMSASARKEKIILVNEEEEKIEPPEYSTAKEHQIRKLGMNYGNDKDETFLAFYVFALGWNFRAFVCIYLCWLK